MGNLERVILSWVVHISRGRPCVLLPTIHNPVDGLIDERRNTTLFMKVFQLRAGTLIQKLQ
jgi:hypothetical protein